MPTHLSADICFHFSWVNIRNRISGWTLCVFRRNCRSAFCSGCRVLFSHQQRMSSIASRLCQHWLWTWCVSLILDILVHVEWFLVHSSFAFLYKYWHLASSHTIIGHSCIKSLFQFFNLFLLNFFIIKFWEFLNILIQRFYCLYCSVQFSCSVMSDSLDPMNCSTPGLPVHHKLPEFTQTCVHRVGDAIQPSPPLSSPSPPAPNPSPHQGLFQWVNTPYQVAKVLEFQLQHQSFQWTLRTDLL